MSTPALQQVHFSEFFHKFMLHRLVKLFQYFLTHKTPFFFVNDISIPEKKYNKTPNVKFWVFSPHTGKVFDHLNEN